MKLKIKVTKDIIRKAMWCKRDKDVFKNCAIALAVRDIFPDSETHAWNLYPMGIDLITKPIPLPEVAQEFIKEFDDLSDRPKARLGLPEIEFVIEVPDKIIDKINISDIHKSATLEVVA
jgi:hypothetical protein